MGVKGVDAASFQGLGAATCTVSTGEPQGENLGPSENLAFPPAGPPPREAISPSPGDSLLLFKQRERISSQSSWAFRLGTSSEQPYIKVGNLFFIDLERNVLDLPEIDMEAAVYVSSVLWVHFQGISLANV